MATKKSSKPARRIKSTRDRSAGASDRSASSERGQKGRSEAEPTALTAAAQAVGRTIGRTTGAVASLLPWNGQDDALDLLEQDHRRMEDLLEQCSKTTARASAKRTELLQAITKELRAHELIEEKVLYPALKKHAEAKDIVLEGYQEHHVADLIVAELQALPPTDERWGAKLEVLKENIEHHIEEEEDDMFKTARSVMSREHLEKLGAQMRAMKEQALQQEPRPKQKRRASR